MLIFGIIELFTSNNWILWWCYEGLAVGMGRTYRHHREFGTREEGEDEQDEGDYIRQGHLLGRVWYGSNFKKILKFLKLLTPSSRNS